MLQLPAHVRGVIRACTPQEPPEEEEEERRRRRHLLGWVWVPGKGTHRTPHQTHTLS